MKKFPLLFLIFIISINFTLAQDSTHTFTPSVAWVFKTSGKRLEVGVFHSVKDSSISIMSTYYNRRNPIELEFDIRNIEMLKVRRKGNVGIGIVLGAVSGAVIGGLIGHTYFNDQSGNLTVLDDGFKTLMVGILGAGGGAVIGSLIGSIKVQYPINGKMENYEKFKADLEKRVLTAEPTS